MKRQDKRNNKLTKFMLLVLLVTMLAIILVAGTYAKYTSTASGTDTAIVAKWSINLNGKDITISGSQQNLTFGLFETIKDNKPDKDTNPSDEEHVAENLIAPGTSGSFDLVVTNKSEVTASYTIDLELVNNQSVPLEFSVDGGETWGSTLPGNFTKTVGFEKDNSTSTTTVLWRWLFESGRDTDDTTLGAMDEAPTVTVKTAITATQVD